MLFGRQSPRKEPKIQRQLKPESSKESQKKQTKRYTRAQMHRSQTESRQTLWRSKGCKYTQNNQVGRRQEGNKTHLNIIKEAKLKIKHKDA